MVTQRIIISESCPKGWSPIFLRLSTSPLKTGDNTITTSNHTPRTIQNLRGILHEINDPRSTVYRERVRYITRCANGMFSRRDAEAVWSMICSWQREPLQRNICIIADNRLIEVAEAAAKAVNDTLFGSTTAIADQNLNTYVYGLMVAYMPHTLRHTVAPTQLPQPQSQSFWSRIFNKGKSTPQ